MFDGPVLNPFANLGLEGLPGQRLTLIGDLKDLAGGAGEPLNKAGGKLFGGGLGHGLAKGDGGSVRFNELKGIVRLFHAGIGYLERGIRRLALLFNQTDQVLKVTEPPVALL